MVIGDDILKTDIFAPMYFSAQKFGKLRGKFVVEYLKRCRNRQNKQKGYYWKAGNIVFTK